jgi:thiol-disulfide isomerase/thioredoxin
MYFFKHALIFSYAIVALACSHSTEPTGKATLTGKFPGSLPVEKTFIVKVSVPNLVSDELKQFDEYETQLTEDGSFSLSIPLFSSVYALLSVNDNDGDYDLVFLSPDKETKLELSLDEADDMQIKLIEGQGLTPEDLTITNRLFMEFIQKVYDPNTLRELRFDMSPEEYRDYFIEWTEKQLSIVEENKNLTENQKQLLYGLLKWYTYIGLLFDYEGQTRYIYEHQQPEKGINDAIFIPQKPDKAYYSFLRFFDWNNSPIFNTPAYPRIFKHILADSVLNIPSIDNLPLADWIKEVKTIMAPLVGSDTGLFYDMLTLHAYLKQLDKELKPLSDSQIKDIKIYFKNPTFYKFLFTANEAMVKQSKLSSIVKETPAVEKEKLMETIVSQYKGKVVVVDFWATWCGPCMQAIKEIKPLKEELHEKNIVFVYIAEPSSPVELWKTKILGIDGDHYYLTEGEKKYLSNHFQIKAIPTYLIFDTKGELKHQITAYPGNTEMRKMIEELL